MAKAFVTLSSSMLFTVISFLAPPLFPGVEGSIGVNYGTVANNLPPPSQVAHFLLESTVINRVKLYDANPDILKAFAHTGIAVTVTVPNDLIPRLTKLSFARRFPAMQTLHTALVAASLDRRIQVSTPHSLGVLSNSSPPSTGKFRLGYDVHANGGVLDEIQGLLYTSMLDAQLDAVFSAMKVLGFDDLEIVIAETGWPSMGDSTQVGVDADVAAEYNGNLMRHVFSGAGTPLMPDRTFETYIFALFNEDLKPGWHPTRTQGILSDPILSDRYFLNSSSVLARSSIPNTRPNTADDSTDKSKTEIVKGKRWCLPKTGADESTLQRNIDYVCGLGLDCEPIQQGGACFLPDTIRAHAAFAMNAYYQSTGTNESDCDFDQTGAITDVDPSYGKCQY
ncbi:putative acyl-coenzyme A binding domain containing [Hibiscus syriacus]|uniref:glucan endo-1,3-beta-D-glucosidase n=1 Tax=Hibiscus syriacus TaxID=106335 RepID=A0A6A3C345_HIBSY|nr:putative acyl-coenzyme A binding domain containing [Hibiscus syriacus]